MPIKRPAKVLKVNLSEGNSKKVRDAAVKEYTTPPRFVNKIVTQHFEKSK